MMHVALKIYVVYISDARNPDPAHQEQKPGPDGRLTADPEEQGRGVDEACTRLANPCAAVCIVRVKGLTTMRSGRVSISNAPLHSACACPTPNSVRPDGRQQMKRRSAQGMWEGR